MTFWRNVLANMLLHGQNALLVVSNCLQNFYQCISAEHFLAECLSVLKFSCCFNAENVSKQKFTFISYTSLHHSSFWSYTYEQTLAKHLPSSSGQNSSSIQIRFRWHRIRHETLLTIFSRRTRLELMLRAVGTGMGAGGAMVPLTPRSLI